MLFNFRDNLSCDTAGPSYFTPKNSSTPTIVRGCAEMPKSISISPIPISPITVFQEISAQPSTSSTHVAEPIAPDNAPTITEPIVTVEVKWQCKTKRRILPADLCSLGKMLCLGIFTQIARAAWRNDKLREQLVLLFLKEIDKEFTGMCSSKRPSMLRKTNR